MRRFHQAFEGILPDASVAALWRGNESGSTGNLLESSYSANFALSVAGSTPGFRAPGYLGIVSTGSGSRFTGTQGWFQSSTSNASPGHFYCNSDWSVSMWAAVQHTAVTHSLLEYASSSTVTTASNLSVMGLYRLANGNLRVQWDLSTSSLGHFADFPTSLNTTAVFAHVAVTKASTSTANLKQVSVYKNGQLSASTYMIGVTSSTAGEGSRWVIGASRRWGTSSGNTPSLSQPLYFDDVGVYSTALQPQKIRELYRNGVRPWGERNLYESAAGKTQSRVLVEDGDGVMVDLSALYGTNWVKSASCDRDVDTQAAKASVELLRYRGPSLNLSPLSVTSQLNYNAASTFEALLDLRRKIRIEKCLVPSEWRVQGWEWETAFEGFIDDISWTADTVSIGAIDKMAPLIDAFQIDPKPYDYYGSTTLAETHLQTFVDDNTPKLITGTSVTTVGYLGGAQQLYTPASSGWALNYDDTPSGDVASIGQSVADQIGWSFRQKWYDPWHQDRLTFYGPPRSKQLSIVLIDTDADGFVSVTTSTDHGLIEGQSLQITSTTSFNGTFKVLEVTAYNRFRCYITSEVEAVTSGMTHWSESTDTFVDLGSTGYFDDKSGFTFTSGGNTCRAVLAFNDDSSSTFVTNVVNGKSGYRSRNNANYLKSRIVGGAFTGNPARPSEVLGSDCTIQWLAKFQQVGDNFTRQADCIYGGSNEQLQITTGSGAPTIRFQRETGTGANAFSSSGGVIHLVTIRKTGTTASWYLDTSFASALTTNTVPSSAGSSGSAAAWNIPSGSATAFDSNAPIHLALMTYNRVLSDAECLQNANYLRNASKFGASAF